MGLGNWVRLGFQEQPETISWKLTFQSGRHRLGQGSKDVARMETISVCSHEEALEHRLHYRINLTLKQMVSLL